MQVLFLQALLPTALLGAVWSPSPAQTGCLGGQRVLQLPHSLQGLVCPGQQSGSSGSQSPVWISLPLPHVLPWTDLAVHPSAHRG